MRIWATGVGIISPLARGARATMDRLLRGDSAFRPLSLFHLPTARSSIAAEVPDLSVLDVAPAAEAEAWSRTDVMAVLSAGEALKQAHLDPKIDTVDLIVGGTIAGMFETEELLAQLSNDPSLMRPFPLLRSRPLSAPTDRVHQVTGPFRRTRTVCTACSSGATAILLAAAWLRLGLSERVLAGAADGLCRLTYSGFAALGALDPKPCRPFDRNRAGLSLGEGGAFVVLETEASAKARGATPLAELRGWAIGSEGHHITNPERDGSTAARVMSEALLRAGLVPSDIDYVNAHGTATPHNDAMETLALRKSLGERARDVPVSSVKGQIGHTLGAAGAIEAAITILAIADGAIPPTGGLKDPDPDCELHHVLTARPANLRSALSNSFGFGGMDTVLAFTKPHAFGPPPPQIQREVVIAGTGTVGPLGVHDTLGSAIYASEGPAPAAGNISFEAANHLDIGRARRLDRSGRLGTAAIQVALTEARPSASSMRSGAILGSSFGNPQAASSYMKRLHEKGAKYASPADFPNLLPSSPAGHASIYLHLQGAVLAVADLDNTAESAMLTAIELVSAGETDLIAAGSVEETSPMIERCLGPVCSGRFERGPRSEGAAIGVFETAESARERGAEPLCRVAFWTSWREPINTRFAAPRASTPTSANAPTFASPLTNLPQPPASALVLSGRTSTEALLLLHGSPWENVPRRSVAERVGDHEGAGGFAVVVACALIARREASAILVLGHGLFRGSALLLVAPEAPL